MAKSKPVVLTFSRLPPLRAGITAMNEQAPLGSCGLVVGPFLSRHLPGGNVHYYQLARRLRIHRLLRCPGRPGSDLLRIHAHRRAEDSCAIRGPAGATRLVSAVRIGLSREYRVARLRCGRDAPLLAFHRPDAGTHYNMAARTTVGLHGLINPATAQGTKSILRYQAPTSAWLLRSSLRRISNRTVTERALSIDSDNEIHKPHPAILLLELVVQSCRGPRS